MSAVNRKRKSDESGSKNDVYFEYLCPITGALPVEPVIAEDGELYDLGAITEWFERNPVAKSPMTNLPIGKNLVPAFHVRKAITRLIASGIISGEDAREWSERQDEFASIHEYKRSLLTNAYRGDATSMREIAIGYREGKYGLKKNTTKYLEWIKKASKKNDATAMCCTAVLFMHGTACRKDVTRGLIELTRAAMLGSENAAICIGNHFGTGEHLIDADENEATWWYNFSKTRTCKDAPQAFKTRRNEWLETHE